MPLSTVCLGVEPEAGGFPHPVLAWSSLVSRWITDVACYLLHSFFKNESLMNLSSFVFKNKGNDLLLGALYLHVCRLVISH